VKRKKDRVKDMQSAAQGWNVTVGVAWLDWLVIDCFEQINSTVGMHSSSEQQGRFTAFSST